MSERDELDDEQELREAEALARALERGTADDDVPEQALQTAALLRYGAGGGALDVERSEEILADVLEAAEKIAARRAEPTPAPWWRGWRGILGLTGVAALAALLLFVWATPPIDVDPTALPTPDARLLSAQMGRIEGADGDAAFEEAMRAYRARVYGALGQRYGAR